MGKILTIIVLLSTTINIYADANAVTLQQRNSVDNGNITRTLNPPAASADGIIYFNGTTILPQMTLLGTGLIYTGGYLTVSKPALALDQVANLTPANYPISNATQTALDAKEGTISAGTTVQYWRGDKTWVNFPSIPAAQVNSDWSASSGVAQILNKPTLATVATTGAYSDLSGKPTIPAAQVNSDWNSGSGLSQILNKPLLSTVATTGAYADLSGKPTLGTAAAQNTTFFATAAQGSEADTALQPSGNGSSLTGITQSQVSGLASALAGKYPNPSGTTSQYVRGDGTLATLPSPGTGTVTSVGVSSTDLTISGSPVTTSGSITANLTTSGVTAGTYSSVTVNNKGIVTAGNVVSVNNAPSRSIITAINVANGFQISSTRACQASYSITISANASGLLAGASSGYVVFEICSTNSATGTDWVEIGRWTNGQSFTSILTLTSVQPVGGDVTKIIPIGYYIRLRSVNVAGTPTYTVNSGQEVLL